MLLTIVGLPKPFEGHIGLIQQNAIESWTRLGDDCEVILLGRDEGTDAVAARLGARHVPDIELNASGTPLVRGVLGAAEEHARGALLCYVNADIILLDDFVETVRDAVRAFPRFLMVGRRTDLDVSEAIDFAAGWQAKLRAHALSRGAVHPATGLDYFVFTRGLFGDIPPLALGRTVWDNWLLYRARERRGELLDASQRVLAIHQSHDYGGRSQAEVWSSPEALENQRLAGGSQHLFTALDATWELTPAGPQKPRAARRRYRHAITWPMLHLGWDLPTRLALRAEYQLSKLRRPAAP